MPDERRKSILIVEDSDVDYDVLQLLLHLIDGRIELIRKTNADAAINELKLRHQKGQAFPSFCLVDLNLIGMSGIELIACLRADPAFAAVPVIILSTSSSPNDVREAYAAGANAYLAKPMGLDRFEELLRSMISHWFGWVELPPNKAAGFSVV
jgi:CheY-like chemotaxis protein